MVTRAFYTALCASLLACVGGCHGYGCGGYQGCGGCNPYQGECGAGYGWRGESCAEDGCGCGHGGHGGYAGYRGHGCGYGCDQGCEPPCHQGCGQRCGGGCGFGWSRLFAWCKSCGPYCWGCGDTYMGDYHSDPPACCEPCDCHGNWVGSSHYADAGYGHGGYADVHYGPYDGGYDAPYYGAPRAPYQAPAEAVPAQPESTAPEVGPPPMSSDGFDRETWRPRPRRSTPVRWP